MIQPLKSSRTTWLVYWIDLEEPVPLGTDYFLPTLVLVCDSSGTPLASPTVLDELDQTRVEASLLRLFDTLGTPDRITICESTDWDEDAWSSFSEEQRVEIRFSRMNSAGPDEIRAIARQVLVRYVTSEAKPAAPTEVATGLLNTALRLNSQSKKEAHLKAALQRDPDCSAARIELADSEFHRGNWKACMAGYEEIIRREQRLWEGSGPEWWSNRVTRPFLRALYGKAMTLWHRGKYNESAALLEQIVTLNPVDNQGARFFIPMLHLLAEDHAQATRAFADYERAYPRDYPEPALLFGWGLCRSLDGDEAGAREKYREGILRNLYIAPMLLEEPLPPKNLWLPNDRAEPNYASEFIDSYAILWDRESGSLRILREAWNEMQPRLAPLIALRERMLDFQDQRYEPEFRSMWQALLDEDERMAKPDKPASP